MKRFVLVLSLMAVMAMLLAAMAVPAFAFNSGTEGGGPPAVSFGRGAVVIHCPAISGDKGNIVFNKQNFRVNNCE